MKRRNFLKTIPVLALGAYSCDVKEIKDKFIKRKIDVGEDFFEKANCIDNIGEQLYEYNLNKKIIYLTTSKEKNLEIKRGVKIDGLKQVKILFTNTTYEGHNIYSIEELILNK